MILCLDDKRNLIKFEEITNINGNDMILIEREGEAKTIKASNLKGYFGSDNGFVFSFSKDDGFYVLTESLSMIIKNIKGLYNYIVEAPSKIEVEVNGVKLLRSNSSDDLSNNSFFLDASDENTIIIYINLLVRNKNYYIQIIKDSLDSGENTVLGCFREMVESELPLIVRLSYSE